MKNKHSQPTQCPTSLKISASYFSETKRICDAALAKAQARVRFSNYTDDNSPTKAQGSDIAPTAFCWANIGDPKGKRAPILRRLEEAEERNRQTTKHNKIPLRQD
jgi:hypothetical protein